MKQALDSPHSRLTPLLYRIVMNPESHNRRADDMSADEVKEFWHGFCERKGVDAATRARGDAKIERDPNYWADQTMVRLLDSVST
jgi:hypothetical protein